MKGSSDSKVGAKKNLRIRAGWCKRQGTKSVPNNLTNQYLWDLDCGPHGDASPVRKSKGMKGNATRCVNCRLLLQICDRQKKTCASAQAGVIHVLNPKLTSPINTSGITTLSTCRQMPPAVNRNSVSQSVTKGLQSLFFLTYSRFAHTSHAEITTPLEPTGVFRKTGRL